MKLHGSGYGGVGSALSEWETRPIVSITPALRTHGLMKPSNLITRVSAAPNDGHGGGGGGGGG